MRHLNLSQSSSDEDEELPVQNKSIGYVMSTEDLNCKHNGRNKVKNEHARKEAKDASIMKVRVGDSKTVREKATSDSVKDTVREIQKRTTYADMVLKGKKGK